MKEVVTSLVIICLALTALARTDHLGDISDGSRAEAVHRIPMYDERGYKITGDMEHPVPFSTKQTCGQCHDYETVSGGLHFNSADPCAPAGRIAQPWILYDKYSGTQVPLSYRPWEGVYHPEDFGLSMLDFVKLFGRHMPGGGPGDAAYKNPEDLARQFISGRAEINCLACHDTHRGYDAAEYSMQILNENYRWGPTGASELANVTGSAENLPAYYDFTRPFYSDDSSLKPPETEYFEHIFDEQDNVLFELSTQIPNRNCYFCHSNVPRGVDAEDRWAVPEDVHIAAGMNCVSCHRNGIEHDIVRGYDDNQSENALAGSHTCERCHENGLYAAPYAKHRGIPVIHFEKMSCTSCHSGQMPGGVVSTVATSRSFGLGIRSTVTAELDDGPTIQTPVYARGFGGKIAPHNLVRPSFWAVEQAGELTPIAYETVKRTADKLIREKYKRSIDKFAGLTEEDFRTLLRALRKDVEQNAVVFVTGGKVYRQDENDKIISTETDKVRACLWPIAHEVRPARQSMGAKSCRECHSEDSAFFFAKVSVDPKLTFAEKEYVQMAEFMGIERNLAKLFGSSFVFRPFLKILTGASIAIIMLVVMLAAIKYAERLINILGPKDKQDK